MSFFEFSSMVEFYPRVETFVYLPTTGYLNHFMVVVNDLKRFWFVFDKEIQKLLSDLSTKGKYPMHGGCEVPPPDVKRKNCIKTIVPNLDVEMHI